MNKAKEIQISPTINTHDFAMKLRQGVALLCDGVKVKITLRFRGREVMNKELERLVKSLAPYGKPDAPPKLIGKGITVMLSPRTHTIWN